MHEYLPLEKVLIFSQQTVKEILSQLFHVTSSQLANYRHSRFQTFKFLNDITCQRENIVCSWWYLFFISQLTYYSLEGLITFPQLAGNSIFQVFKQVVT